MLYRKPEGKRPFERQRRRLEDDFIVDIRRCGLHSAGSVVSLCERCKEPSDFIKGKEFN
jgi:hypothetical protein